MGDQSASTVVSALSARSAVGREYASTVVGAVRARSAVGHNYASMVVSAISAKIATRRNSSTNVSSSTYYVMTPTPNNTHASQLTTNEPTIRSNNSALLASNPSVVALALSTYTKPPFTAAVHKTRRQHTNCPYNTKIKKNLPIPRSAALCPLPVRPPRRTRRVVLPAVVVRA